MVRFLGSPLFLCLYEFNRLGCVRAWSLRVRRSRWPRAGAKGQNRWITRRLHFNFPLIWYGMECVYDIIGALAPSAAPPCLRPSRRLLVRQRV
jgi:hypothetical protein